MSETARWYVIHTYSGYENNVANSIRKSVENRKLGHLIEKITVPTEMVTEIKNGKEKEVARKIFPSYVLIKMLMNDETWYVVRNIRGVTGFVGPGSKPVPLTEDEVDRMGIERAEGESKTEIELSFAVGDSVRLTEGSFAGYIGPVTNIDLEKKTATVIISMMGQEVPTEVDLRVVASIVD